MGVALGEPIELGEQYRSLELREWTDVVAALKPQTSALGHVGMACQEGAAAAGGQQLGAAETEDAHVTPGSGSASLHPRAGCLSRVLNHRHALPSGLFHDLTHGHQPTVQVRGDHGAGRRSERGRQLFGSEVPVLGIDIDQHRPGADGVDAEEIAAVIVGGHHDLITRTDLQRTQRQLDRKRATAAGKGVANAMLGR